MCDEEGGMGEDRGEDIQEGHRHSQPGDGGMLEEEQSGRVMTAYEVLSVGRDQSVVH